MMTVYCHRSVLLAAMVFASGLCLSDAFSTKGSTSILSILKESRQQPPTLITRYYAPRTSNLSEQPPKRRRRKASKTKPRRSTVSAAATVTNSATVVDSGSRTKKRTRTNKISESFTKLAALSNNNKKTNKKKQPIYSTGYLMTGHKLLTKQKEIELGTKVRRALQCQEKLTSWMEEKQQLENESSRRGLFGYDHTDFDTDDDAYAFSSYSDRQSLMEGSASSQAVDQHYLQEQIEEEKLELFYQDGTPFEDDYGYGLTTDYTTQRTEDPSSRYATIKKESWMDDILLNRRGSASTLTDQDIQKVVGLEGGRNQLRTILLEGALAREQLISNNVRLVVSIAKRWAKSESRNDYYPVSLSNTSPRPTLEEAVQEGVFGLAEAAERYEPERGLRFSTYATVWVTNKVRACFQAESTPGLRLPQNFYEYKRKYIKLVRQYLDEEGEVPDVEVLADDLGLSVKRLKNILKLTQPIWSIDTPISARSDGKSGAGQAGVRTGEVILADNLESDEPQPEFHVERSFLRQCLENAMATELNPSERDILRLRLGLDDGEPRSVKEVSTILGDRLSLAAVRNIEQRAFKKLRSPFAVHTRKLQAYLDFAGIDSSTLRS